MSQQSIAKLSDLTPDLGATADVRPIRGLWRLTRGFRIVIVGVLISLAIAVIARTGTYLVIRYFVDDFLVDPSSEFDLWLIAGGFILLTALQGVFSFVSGALAARSSEGIVQRLRNYLLNHVQRLPFTYHDNTQTGELIQRATSDVDAVRRFFAVEVIASSRIVFLFLVNFVAILFLDWRLALISIIVVPFILILSVYFFRLVSRAYDDYQQQEAVLTTALQENLTGVRVVKAFARQQYEVEKFETANHGKYVRGKRLLLMHSMYWPISDVLCGVQMLAGFIVGALMAINGVITVGTYIAYAGMVLLIIWPMRNLGRLVVEMSRGLVSFDRLAEVIRVAEEPLEPEARGTRNVLHGEIVFDDVSFAYDSGRNEIRDEASDESGSNGDLRTRMNGSGIGRATLTPKTDTNPTQTHAAVALRNISFTVLPGQRVALVGGAGAGKTSLVNLLPRFYDYTSGSISLDGVELRDYSREFLRRNIGTVEQEPFLFSRSVRDNITYGVGRDVPQGEIEEAARAAAIHEVIMEKLPDGYDTLVGERGTTLSGGQKQRVAIARTILKDPRILILDDSTSAVDTETEAAIRQALERLMVGRTTFIIAHRIQSVMAADLIIVLEQGRIVQAGKHHELVEKDGMYRRIYHAQTRMEGELTKELSGDSAP